MKESLLSLLGPFGQEHLLQFWDELTPQQREHLADQIRKIDFAMVAKLFALRDSVIDLRSFEERAKDPPAYKFGDLSSQNLGTGDTNYTAPVKITKTEAIQKGEGALADGKCAVILVAGGQGTRLGSLSPKGMFPIGPVSNASLFQIHLEKTLALSRKFDKPIPICVMCSPATQADTVKFLEEKDWFGIPEEDRFLFCQGTMPAVSMETGQVLLTDKDQIALSPNGHGGMLAALVGSDPLSVDGEKQNLTTTPSVLECLAQRGIENLFYFQVDNPFVDICAPEFLGYHIGSGSEMTSQVIRKREPSDRVGNVVELDGKLNVIEYSDIPESLANRRFLDGSLQIWAGSIAVHIFRLDFLRRSEPNAAALPFHVARKKVPFINPNGSTISPQVPNAIKFERFIFDLMPHAQNAVVVEVDIPHNYGPLKNAAGFGSDCPETVQAQLLALYREWLIQAGANVPENVPVEISPLYALNAEELAAKIKPGTTFEEPTYLR